MTSLRGLIIVNVSRWPPDNRYTRPAAPPPTRHSRTNAVYQDDYQEASHAPHASRDPGV